MVITAHFEAKGMDSGLQNYLSTIAETSNLHTICCFHNCSRLAK